MNENTSMSYPKAIFKIIIIPFFKWFIILPAIIFFSLWGLTELNNSPENEKIVTGIFSFIFLFSVTMVFVYIFLKIRANKSVNTENTIKETVSIPRNKRKGLTGFLLVIIVLLSILLYSSLDSSNGNNIRNADIEFEYRIKKLGRNIQNLFR